MIPNEARGPEIQSEEMPTSNDNMYLDATRFGAKLDDIQLHLIRLRSETEETIGVLDECLAETIKNRSQVNNVEEIGFFIECMAEEMQRFSNVFERLISELPTAVEPKHLRMLQEIVDYSKDLDHVCLEFKRQHIEAQLKDESLRWLIDRIYKESRSQILTFKSLSGLVINLETFVGTTGHDHSVSVDDIDAFELKPNFFGIGINLNYIVKRLAKIWNRGSNSNT